MKLVRAVMVMFLSLAFVGVAFAQPRPRSGRPNEFDREESSRQFKKIRAKVLREKVGLSEEKAALVEAVLDAHDADRHELREKMRENSEGLRTLLKEDSNDQDAYTALLDEVLTTRQALQDLRGQELDEIREILTPKEQAKLVLALRKMHRRGRKMMMKRGKARDNGRKYRGRRCDDDFGPFDE